MYAFVLYKMYEKFIKNVFPLLITNTFPSFYQAFGIFKIKIHLKKYKIQKYNKKAIYLKYSNNLVKVY